MNIEVLKGSFTKKGTSTRGAKEPRLATSALQVEVPGHKIKTQTWAVFRPLWPKYVMPH